MPRVLARPGGYRTLVRKIKREFTDVELFVKNRIARGYWNVGKYIDEHLLQHRNRAGYATGFYERLARDVGREPVTLNQAVRFYRAYPILGTCQELTWGHYRKLLTVKDPRERKSLEKRILRQKWNTHDVQNYLNTRRKSEVNSSPVSSPPPQLKFTRGRVYTYLIVTANETLRARGEGPLALDLGFRMQSPLPSRAPRLKAMDMVELFSAGEKRGEKTTGLRKVAAPADEVFTYRAAVERVIDGDTIVASFDFGVPASVSWKLRLRGIDCPEVKSRLGRRAKQFVERTLKACPFIIVKTTKDRTDRYDRYLADIFFLPGAADPAAAARDGRYLNQELLDAGLAAGYTG